MSAVVGAAIVRGGRVLAARRTTPPVGRWELPGGKVEPGESPDEALMRELREELGVQARVEEWLPGRSRIGEGLVLTVAAARITGEPRPVVHDVVRWLGPDELGTVDWAEADRPFLPHVAELLRRPRARGILFEEADALAVADALTVAGWSAEVSRERYQGEDDDEDHPWAVETDAPALLLELQIEEHDGWLDVPGEPAVPRVEETPALPTEPRRRFGS